MESSVNSFSGASKEFPLKNSRLSSRVPIHARDGNRVLLYCLCSSFVKCFLNCKSRKIARDVRRGSCSQICRKGQRGPARGPVFGKEDGETISKLSKVEFETDELYLSRRISSSLIISFRRRRNERNPSFRASSERRFFFFFSFPLNKTNLPWSIKYEISVLREWRTGGRGDSTKVLCPFFKTAQDRDYYLVAIT